MIKCKVIGCSNSEAFIKESAKHETMKGCFGYCQIHCIEGLIKETSDSLIKTQEKKDV